MTKQITKSRQTQLNQLRNYLETKTYCNKGSQKMLQKKEYQKA